jgi:hypothetical protein
LAEAVGANDGRDELHGFPVSSKTVLQAVVALMTCQGIFSFSAEKRAQ